MGFPKAIGLALRFSGSVGFRSLRLQVGIFFVASRIILGIVIFLILATLCSRILGNRHRNCFGLVHSDRAGGRRKIQDSTGIHVEQQLGLPGMVIFLNGFLEPLNLILTWI